MMSKHHAYHFCLPTSKGDALNFSERINEEKPGRSHRSTLFRPTSKDENSNYSEKLNWEKRGDTGIAQTVERQKSAECAESHQISERQKREEKKT